MALQEFHNPGLTPGDLYDMDVIAALHDEPNADDNLSAAQLKAKFDEGGKAIQNYINGTLKDFVDDLESGTGLADGSVTTAKLADDAVTAAKIADGQVWTDHIADAQVTTDKLALQAVTSNKIADGAVNSYKLAADSVMLNHLKDGSVSTDKIVALAVKEGKIGTGAVTTAKIGDEAVTTAKIANLNVTTAKLADSSVKTAKINDGAVTTAKLDTNAVTLSKIADNAVMTSKIANKNVTKAKLEDSVQASLGKADTAYQKPGTGIPSSDMATAVQTSLGLADTALQSAHEVPAGGTSGQVLSKNSNTDYDLKWVNQSGGGGSSDYDDLTDKPSINSVTLSGNKTTSDLKLDQIFWATYGTTSANDIETAYQAGKTILCKYNGYVYTMMYRGSSTLFRFFAFNNGSNNAYYIACSSGTWTNGSVDFGPPLSDVAAKALGTASAGTSTTASRSDHVHAKPSASDIGAVAVAQGVAHAGEFVVVGSDGNITTVTMTAWQGGSY